MPISFVAGLHPDLELTLLVDAKELPLESKMRLPLSLTVNLSPTCALMPVEESAGADPLRAIRVQSKGPASRALLSACGFLLGIGLASSAPSAYTQDLSDRGPALAVSKLDDDITNLMQKTGVPGVSVAVVYRDQVIYLKGFGVRKLGEEQAVDADTVFQIASVSKPISTTVVAAVVGSGKVSWDDRVKDLDPNFKLSDPHVTDEVTVRDFLSHRSTLPEDAGDTLESLGYSRPTILHKLRLVPLNGVFRRTYQYSNFGITEGVLAATRSSGGTWEDLAEKLLYRKLGMTRTSSRFSDYFNRSNRATPHYLDADGFFKPRYLREADAEAPAGGVSSSARDLAQWVRLQLADGVYDGEQVVQKAALDETHKPMVCRDAGGAGSQLACPGNHHYGLGWNVDYRKGGELQISHSGAFLLGAATTVYIIPSKQIGIVVLTNGTPVGLPETVALNFLDDFEYGKPQDDYFTILRKDFKDVYDNALNSSTNYLEGHPRTGSAPGAPASALVGTYDNPYYGKVQVEEQAGKLVLRLPPLGNYYELSHWNGDTYTYYIANESSGATRRGVTFGNGGHTLTVQNLNFEYSDVFEKVDP